MYRRSILSVAFGEAVVVGFICALIEETGMPKKQSTAQKKDARNNRMIFTLPMFGPGQRIDRIYTVDRDLADRKSTSTARRELHALIYTHARMLPDRIGGCAKLRLTFGAAR
jgi:hypothetical protein